MKMKCLRIGVKVGTVSARTFVFAGTGGSAGTMICAQCHKPIDSKTQDWAFWKKTKNGDWGYVSAHRRCLPDQSGWEKQIKEKMEAEKRYKAILHDLRTTASKFGITDGYYFAEAAADALGISIDT
jgi:hypothetical protein